MLNMQLTGRSRAFLTLSLLLIIFPGIFGYPVFGTKRYGRSTGLSHRVSTWGVPAPLPLQAYQQPHTQTHYGLAAPTYYTTDPIVSYPYSQDYPENDYYYAQEPAYPYYPTAKYPVYRSVVPYYYGDGRQTYGYYGYDESSDPVDDLQEEIQEEEREEREEALPIGQETWFEGGSAAQRQPQGDSMADVNAAFLQNLIMSQMYNDANSGHVLRHPPYAGSTFSVVDDNNKDSWLYDRNRGQVYGTDYYQNSDEDVEDEDVKELKSLVKKNLSGELGDRADSSPNNWFSTHRPEYYEPIWFPNENGPWYANNWNSGMSYKRNADEPVYQSIRSYNKKQESSEYGPWIPKGNINFSDRKGNAIVQANNLAKMYQQQQNAKKNKAGLATPRPSTTPIPITSTTTSAPVEATSTSFDSRRGQKEVALLRPPTPVRHPFTPPILDKVMTRSRPSSSSSRHESSVYDTIKQLLSMEQGLRKDAGEMDHSRPQKRFVSNEESLVEELSGLKKLAA